MENYYRQGIKVVKTKDIIDCALNEFKKISQKTVNNTLGIMVNSRKICRPRKGVYKLPDSYIQKIEKSIPDQNHREVNKS